MPRKPEPSFGLKQIVWDIAATNGTDNYSVIYRELDQKLEELRREGKAFENLPDLRKVKDIIVLDIQLLKPEVVIAKLPPYVWHLRLDYEEIKQLAEIKTQTSQHRGEKQLAVERRASHQRDMLQLVKKYFDQLAALLNDMPKSVAEPLYSHYVGPVGMRKPTSRSSYPFGQDDDPWVLVIQKWLGQHFSSSDEYRWLFDKGKGFPRWEEVSRLEWEKRSQFAEKILDHTQHETGRTVDDDGPCSEFYDPEMEAAWEAPSTFFCESLWLAVFDPAWRVAHYSDASKIPGDETWEIGFIALIPRSNYVFGDNSIAHAPTPEKVIEYSEQHKKLIVQLCADPMVGEILHLRTERKSIGKSIAIVLAKVLADGEVPGKCDSKGCCASV